MSEIIETVQYQDPGSELITLYDLEYDPGGATPFAYFYAGLDENLNEIQFRDASGTARSYTALPLTATGFDINSDGAYSRPEMTIANLESVFSDEIGGLSFEDLIGKRVTKRTTLRKYLVGESGDSGAGNAPVEFPKVVYIIDRIKEKNIIQVTFELSAPFDLIGVRLPRRIIVGGMCPWLYRGRTSSAFSEKIGGCSWDQKTIGGGTNTSGDPIYMNAFDEYIVPSSLTFTSAGTNVTAGNYYTTSTNLTRINSNGTQTTVSVTQYWQAKTTSTSATQPSDTDPTNWRRVRVYSTYSSSATYYGYTDTKFNEYILENSILWKVKSKTQDSNNHAARKGGVNWTEGDVCGKKIKSCSLRFGAISDGNGGVSISTLNNSLPFGGFPGAIQRR